MKDTPPDLKLLWKQYQAVIISLSLLSAFYFFIRLPNLTLLPIFADEAIYIRWAQIMRAEATLRFLPLTDGKQPLFMWLMIPFLKVISDPLIAGRITSVLAGFGSLLGIFFLTHQLTKSQKHALIASLLSAIIPFTFFFDRMALVDGLLNMFGVWAMFFAIKLIQKPQLDYSMLTGTAIGAAWLTKSPAIFFLGLLPLTLLTNKFFNFIPTKKWDILNKPFKNFTSRIKTTNSKIKITPHLWYFARLIFFWLLTALISYSIYNLLRLGPEYHQIAIRNQDYLYPFSEISRDPFSFLLPHLQTILDFFWKLLTPTIFIISLIGIFISWKRHAPTTIFLLIWIFLPLLIQAQFARSLTARYFLYLTPPILIFSSEGIHWLINKSKNYLWKLAVIFIILIPCLWFNFQLLISPELAPLPRIERHGYLEEWTSGTGLRAVANYLRQESNAYTIVLGTEGFFGTMPDGIQIYFDKNPRVTIVGQTHIIDHVPQQLYDSLDQNKVYLLVNDTRFKISQPQSVGLQLIKAFPKAKRPDHTKEHLLFFELTHQPKNRVSTQYTFQVS